MFYLTRKASKARLREAENARRNRAEIVQALSTGQISRRDLIKWGMFTAGGLLVAKSGLSPFVKSAFADGATGTLASPYPLPTDKAFMQPLLRLHNVTRHPLTSTGGSDARLIWPDALGEAPAMRRANTNIIRHKCYLADATNTGAYEMYGTTGPQEGRPHGEAFAHQRWNDLVNGAPGPDGEVSHPLPPVGVVMSVGQVAPNLSYNLYNNWHAQEPSAVWTFAEGRFQRGKFPPLLLQARYGESVINRIYNNLPFYDPQWSSTCFPDCGNTTNGGFGRQEPAIHNHNGHNGCESDGAQNAHFFPGQYYDYHYSLMLARRDAGLKDSRGRDLDKLLKVNRGDLRSSTPTNDGGIIPVPGDFREIQSTLWFHDHRISYTSENVYKGYCAMLEYFSGTDRGYERPLGNADADKVNLRLPSGWRNNQTWGNRDFDVYLAIQDVAFDQDAQLRFDIFDTDGFLGDVMHVNYQWKPTLDVLPRKYRIRTLSAGMSRWVKLAVTDSLNPDKARAVPITIIANDGNIFPRFVRNAAQMDVQGTAERYDFVIDFSRGSSPAGQVGKKYYLVNLCEHQDGKGPSKDLTLAEGLSGNSADPCVGRFLEFRIARNPSKPDVSQVPDTLIPNPDLSKIPVVRERVFEWGRGAEQTTNDPVSSFFGPWGVKVDGGRMLAADFGRVSAAPRYGTREIWTLKNGGGGWDHPVHIHFEEGQVLARNGSAAAVPPWERGRKDVYRLRPGGSVTVSLQFRDWGGVFMEHCHNTVHEDNAMLLRWDIETDGSPLLRQLPSPIPTPQGVKFQTAGDVLPTAY
jgi:FtsP/CotA-like multicopper oxidase with cupredoxin domain